MNSQAQIHLSSTSEQMPPDVYISGQDPTNNTSTSNKKKGGAFSHGGTSRLSTNYTNCNYNNSNLRQRNYQTSARRKALENLAAAQTENLSHKMPNRPKAGPLGKNLRYQSYNFANPLTNVNLHPNAVNKSITTMVQAKAGSSLTPRQHL